jgi:hypothetical protein
MITNFGMIEDDDGVEVALVNYHDIWGLTARKVTPAPDLRIAAA